MEEFVARRIILEMRSVIQAKNHGCLKASCYKLMNFCAKIIVYRQSGLMDSVLREVTSLLDWYHLGEVSPWPEAEQELKCIEMLRDYFMARAEQRGLQPSSLPSAFEGSVTMNHYNLPPQQYVQLEDDCSCPGQHCWNVFGQKQPRNAALKFWRNDGE